MMMHGMGGGIGATMILGWPLADWATIMLLLIVSVMDVAFGSAALRALKLWLNRTPPRAQPEKQAQPLPEVSSE